MKSPWKSLGFPSESVGKETPCSAGDPASVPEWRRCPGLGNGKPTPVFSPGEPHGQRSLVGYSPRGHTVSDTTT